jgi:hypothetical protein
MTCLVIWRLVRFMLRQVDFSRSAFERSGTRKSEEKERSILNSAAAANLTVKASSEIL